jgi:UDP-N-acetylmuramate dehydrogenase
MSEKKYSNQESILQIAHEVSLAPLTTLELGGTASSFVVVDRVETAKEAIQWAGRNAQPVAILGGGSNVIVSDTGFAGLAVQAALRGVQLQEDGKQMRVKAAAGEPWDEVVEMAVAEDLAGIECLSGIPGWVGATPIQNVGAYGQDVATVIEGVRVLDLMSLEERTLGREACGFGYRTSSFREFPGRFMVLSVTFVLERGGEPKIEYRELRRALGIGQSAPGLAEVRRTVLELRRSKSMLVEEDDPNRRSVGSFFINPVIDASSLAALDERARATGGLASTESVPTFKTDSGAFKVPAAWLIEKAGFSKGLRRGAFGISSAHALALVHHGGGSSEELVALARDIREGVRRKFDIELQPEPVFLGFPTANPLSDGLRVKSKAHPPPP